MLAANSLWNRRLTSALVVLSIALSVALLLGVERLHTQTRTSFANTLSGTDLIVGARGSPINLLLYSVFRIGDPTNNVRWSSYQAVSYTHLDVYKRQSSGTPVITNHQSKIHISKKRCAGSSRCKRAV